MNSLIEKIVAKLQCLPETALQEVVNFVDLLASQKMNYEELPVVGDDLWEEHDAGWLETDISNLGSYEPYDWQPGELDKGLPIKHIPGIGVVISEE